MDKNWELSSFAAFFSFSCLGQGSLLVEVFSFVSCVSPLLLWSPEIYRTVYYQFTQVAQKMHRGRCYSASKNLWVNIQKYAEVCGEYCAVIIDMWRYRDKEEDWWGGSPSYSWMVNCMELLPLLVGKRPLTSRDLKPTMAGWPCLEVASMIWMLISLAFAAAGQICKFLPALLK